MQYLLMLASAFGLGAAHALEPGHGKTIVAAYLVGSKGRALDAVILGAVVTFTHTFSVIILAVISVAAAAYFVPEQVQRALAVGSGLLVLAVGAWMIFARARNATPARSRSPLAAHELHARGNHEHAHGHSHVHDAHPAAPARVGGGSLVALGISGGIVPCPAALLLIPAAVGLGAAAKGIGLVLSFSLGLAVVLITVGIVSLRAASLAGRWLERENWARRVSLASACFITILGLALTLKAVLGG